MVGSYSWVHWPRTRRRVMEDLPVQWEISGRISGRSEREVDIPHPPSPQIVIVIRSFCSIVV